MSHIAVNTRLLLSHRLEGISRFAFEVLRRMVLNNPEIRFSFFFDRAYDPKFVFADNVTPYVVPPQARHPLLWHAWFHAMVPWHLNRLKPDAFFSPEFYLTSARTIPQVPVFHDIAYEHFPEAINRWASRYCRKYSPIYANAAKQILTVSEFGKQDLIKYYGLPEEKIHVVYNGVSEGFGPIPEAQQQQVRNRYTGGAPYFHFVGTLHPRKNIEMLLNAFDQFKRNTSSDIKLLLVGRKGWKYESAFRAYQAMRFKEDVLFTGFVSDQALSEIYAASIALCYVPIFEGFGIPILEAMQSETAVICSNTTAMPEVAGNAAALVSPFEIDEIALAMKRVAFEEIYRNRLIQAGKQQRQKFSWDQTYQRVWQTLAPFLG